jgi:hypothetical protein
MLIFTMYGGGFATIPAYLADTFGTAHVGGIHGRLLTAWSTAGIAGPLAVTHLRKRSHDSAVADLAERVEPAAFEQAFGASKEALPALVESSTVTIGRLLEIAPHGTIDPTPMLYNGARPGPPRFSRPARASSRALASHVSPRWQIRCTLALRRWPSGLSRTRRCGRYTPHII